MSDEEITWWLNQIWLGAELFPSEREYLCKYLHKIIQFFTYNYKDLREITLKMHKFEPLQIVKVVR